MNAMNNIRRPHILTPKFPVLMTEEKGRHIYETEMDGIRSRFGSVTEYLGIISKPALVPWAKKEALSVVEMELLKRLDGKESSSVLLDKSWIQNLLKDAKKRPDKIKEQAADLGTQAHAFIDLIIHGNAPETVPEEIAGPIQSFRDWWMKSGIELVMGDTKVASLLYGYGGSLDALGWRNEKFVILDWKTSNNVYTEYALQVAAYAQAFYETYGVSCAEAVIVRFGKKPPIDFEARDLCDLSLSFKTFLDAKSLKENLDKPHFMPF